MMKNISEIFFAIGIAFIFNGFSETSPLLGYPHGANHPLSKSETDTRPPIQFDVSKPYRLEFGRGSGLEGLDTIALDENGHIILHRLKVEEKNDVIHHYWERSNLYLSAQMTEEIAKLILDLRILDMKRAYHADVHDGTQWIFWLVQDGQEKSIYFNNHFPKAIQKFAVELDNKLKIVGIENAQWTRVPDKQTRQHEKAIWDSIEEKPNIGLDNTRE